MTLGILPQRFHFLDCGLLQRFALCLQAFLHEIEAPAELARFIAEKGSVTLDGVSLTVGRVAGASFAIDLIPHTLKVTTLSSIAPGQALNPEVDLLVSYLDQLLEARGVR